MSQILMSWESLTRPLQPDQDHREQERDAEHQQEAQDERPVDPGAD
jgi:hypothetical protein